jgi:streptogramin lyase
VLAIVGAPDGTLWYTDLRDHTINHLDPASGAVRTYPVTGVSYTPSSPAFGPDGNVWFGDPFATNLFMVSPEWQ